MILQQQEIQAIQEDLADKARSSKKKVRFDKDKGFQVELGRRVDEFFEQSGRRKRDCPEMYLKTAILIGSFATFYWLLVFQAQTVGQAIICAILLGLAGAGIGFSVQHDGGHGGYSDYPLVNKLMSLTIEFLGASSYNWHWKHNMRHHIYTNISGYDNDIDIGVVGRLSADQPWFFFHQWQHYYLWFLYGLMVVRWHFYDDFHDVLVGRIGVHPYPSPKGLDRVIFWSGKALFFTLAFVIPSFFHPFWAVILCYGVSVFTFSLTLCVVFQLAHVVESVDFPLPSETTGQIDSSWTIHQIETTADFARDNPVISWFTGGLNFQVEHHLFPQICHVNYPAISKIVEETCEEFGVKYRKNQSFTSAVKSHFNVLQEMAMPTMVR